MLLGTKSHLGSGVVDVAPCISPCADDCKLQVESAFVLYTNMRKGIEERNYVLVIIWATESLYYKDAGGVNGYL